MFDEFLFPEWKCCYVVSECDGTVVVELTANVKVKSFVDACFWYS